VRSATSVLANLDRKRFDATPSTSIRTAGGFLPSRPPDASTDADAREYVREQARSFRHDSEV